MEAEFSNSTSSSINVNLEVKIKDFRTSSKSEKEGEYTEDPERNFNVWFSALVSPNGFDKDTEGWLIVRPYVTVTRGTYRPQSSVLSWTVSLIDIEGNARFPKSFMQDLSKDITDAKYLERSFILDRADDFLTEGVLTVRCDVCFQWYNDSPSSAPDNDPEIAEAFIPDVPELDQNDTKTEDPIDDHKEFVRKNKILTELLYFPELEKVSSIYDPPSREGRHPKTWKFDTRDESINLILDERFDNLGGRLLKASPVIRRCANAPMKEQRERRIEFPHVDSQTFKSVLYFLVKETLPKFEFNKLLEIYKFSHTYGMDVLKRNCAEDMVNSLELESDFKELQKFAEFYLDEYLSELLYVRRHEYENSEGDLLHEKMDDRPYYDYYT